MELERERVTVQEAAQRLGVTESAIRKRIQRELIDHEKEPDGRVYVYLDARDRVADSVPDSSYDLIVSRLENEVEFLRGELQRKDALLMNMTEAMKAIAPPTQEEPPQEPTEAPQEGRAQPGRVGHQTPIEGPQRAIERPWWRRMFGG